MQSINSDKRVFFWQMYNFFVRQIKQITGFGFIQFRFQLEKKLEFRFQLVDITNFDAWMTQKNND